VEFTYVNSSTAKTARKSEWLYLPWLPWVPQHKTIGFTNKLKLAGQKLAKFSTLDMFVCLHRALLS